MPPPLSVGMATTLADCRKAMASGTKPTYCTFGYQDAANSPPLPAIRIDMLDGSISHTLSKNQLSASRFAAQAQLPISATSNSLTAAVAARTVVLAGTAISLTFAVGEQASKCFAS